MQKYKMISHRDHRGHRVISKRMKLSSVFSVCSVANKEIL
jgi:hypothetical protein